MSRLLLLRIGLLALARLCRTAPGLAAASPAPPREEKRVPLLSGENKDNPGQQLAEQGIREALHSTTRFAIQPYGEYLDASRFGARAPARAMADFLREWGSDLTIATNSFKNVKLFGGQGQRWFFGSMPDLIKAAVRAKFVSTRWL